MIENPIFRKSIETMKNVYCRDISWDYGFAMWFGQPKLEVIGERSGWIIPKRRGIIVTGKWKIWLFSDWWIKYDGITLASGSTKSQRRIQRVCYDLQGQKLINWTIDRNMVTRFEFDLGISIISKNGLCDKKFVNNSYKKELWELSKPSGYFLNVYDDNTFTHEPGSGIDQRKGSTGKIIPDLELRRKSK